MTGSKISVADNINKNKLFGKKGINREAATQRSLKTSSLVYFLFILFLSGTVMLFAAGVFNTTSIQLIASQVPANTADPHGGASMEQLQKINDLEKVIENNPEDYDSVLKLAHMLNDSGFYERAIEMYGKYITGNPGDADVIVDKGVCYYQLKKYDEAISTMMMALKINPKHQIANFNLGIVNFSNNNIDEAKMWWKKAIELDPATDIANKAQELINSN